jgi:hypothetical protein
MGRALSIVVLISVLPAWTLLDRALKALTRRHRAPRQKQLWYQGATELAGFLALGLVIWPWRPRLGMLWIVDILLLAFGFWGSVVNVLLFGVPDRVPQG